MSGLRPGHSEAAHTLLDLALVLGGLCNQGKDFQNVDEYPCVQLVIPGAFDIKTFADSEAFEEVGNLGEQRCKLALSILIVLESLLYMASELGAKEVALSAHLEENTKCCEDDLPAWYLLQTTIRIR